MVNIPQDWSVAKKTQSKWSPESEANRSCSSESPWNSIPFSRSCGARKARAGRIGSAERLCVGDEARRAQETGPPRQVERVGGRKSMEAAFNEARRGSCDFESRDTF